MKMKTARFGSLIITAWDNETVTIYNEETKRLSKNTIFTKDPYGAYGITYIVKNGKRILLDEFNADCGGSFLHHWKFD